MPYRPFPTANGPSQNINAANDGRVIFVDSTTTAQNAFLQTGERIIIPIVSGYESIPNFTVTGTTRGGFEFLGALAPNGGFALRDGQIAFAGVNNFIVRDLKVRRGVTTSEGDAFSAVAQSGGLDNSDFIIDHSSFTWGNDETLSLAAQNAIVQYCIIAEPMHDAGHSKGVHGFCGLWGAKNIAFHHNFFSSGWDRHPLFQNPRNLADGLLDFRNNALFNWVFRPSYLGDTVKMLNLIKNSYTPTNATNVSGITQQFLRFIGSEESNLPGVYPFGNVLRNRPTIAADVESQKQGIAGSNGTNTTLWRDTVVKNTPFSIGWTYDFDETVAQSDLIIQSKCGPHRRDVVDQRLINEWITYLTNPDLTNLNNPPLPVTKRGSVSGILGLIDRPSDVGGYPDLNVGSETILSGPLPHRLPSWFTTKYALSTSYDYTTASTKIANPERYIIFGKGPQGIQLSQYGGSVDYDNDVIHNVYRVLYFHVTGEIDLLENPTNTLTVQAVIGGTVNTSGGEYIPSAVVNLIATANTGFRFVRWRRVSNDSTVSLVANFNYLMPSENVTLEAVFEPFTPPPSTGTRVFRIPSEPIV